MSANPLHPPALLKQTPLLGGALVEANAAPVQLSPSQLAVDGNHQLDADTDHVSCDGDGTALTMHKTPQKALDTRRDWTGGHDPDGHVTDRARPRDALGLT
jgi:hypothetical protein